MIMKFSQLDSKVSILPFCFGAIDKFSVPILGQIIRQTESVLEALCFLPLSLHLLMDGPVGPPPPGLPILYKLTLKT